MEDIKKHHYVEHLIDSVDSDEEAVKLVKQVTEIHRTGDFTIRNCRLQRNIMYEPIVPAKREVLKVLMFIYDPMAFVSCYTIRLKILLQDIWRLKINWDDELPEDCCIAKSKLALLNPMTIPRL